MTARDGVGITARDARDHLSSAVLAWCDWYTRGLPDDIALERRDELASDLHDHRADALVRAEADGRHARAVVTRALLGAPADLSWRSHQLRVARSARRQEKQMSVAARRDGRMTVAYVLGSLVAAWSAVVSVGLLYNVVAPDRNDEDRLWGWSVGLAALVCLGLAVWGLTALARRPRAACIALAVASVVTTVWMTWALWLAAVGVLVAGFFVVYAVRASSAERESVAV